MEAKLSALNCFYVVHVHFLRNQKYINVAIKFGKQPTNSARLKQASFSVFRFLAPSYTPLPNQQYMLQVVPVAHARSKLIKYVLKDVMHQDAPKDM